MYFWFQPLAGIHTSMPMLESAVGVAVITTRQNAGMAARVVAGRTPWAGAVKSPAGTAVAETIVALLGVTRAGRSAQATGSGSEPPTRPGGEPGGQRTDAGARS